MNEPGKSFYEFDSFRVDVARRLLLREGAPVRLTPKAFETLLALVRGGGRVLGKGELMSAIWPDSFVEEGNLAQNVFLLRRALGEAKGEHRFIVTVPGAGYLFAARAREPGGSAAPPARPRALVPRRRAAAAVRDSGPKPGEVCIMRKQTVATKDAPAPVGPYSQAVVAGGFVFASGQAGLDPATGELVGGDVAGQTERVLRNLRAVLEAAGSGLERVVKTTVFLADMDDFAAMNEVYARFFPREPPARTTVQAARLPLDALVEIELIALAGE